MTNTDTPIDCPPLSPAALRLAQLAEVYDQAEAEAKAATERLDALKAAVKAELYTLRLAGQVAGDGLTHAEYSHPALRAPWVLDYRTADRVDTKALRKAHPDLAEQFTKTTGAWYLTRGRA